MSRKNGSRFIRFLQISIITALGLTIGIARADTRYVPPQSGELARMTGIYDTGGPNGYSTCVASIDGAQVGTQPTTWCEDAERVLTVQAGWHEVKIAMVTRDEDGRREASFGTLGVTLAAGHVYTVQGQLRSSDRMRFWLADADGVRIGDMIASFLEGRGSVRFLDKSGRSPAQEKHSLYVAVELGPKSGPVETDFIKTFAGLVFSCQADAAILSLPRADGKLTLDSPKQLTLEDIRARAIKANAEGLLVMSLTEWSTGQAVLDSSSPLSYGDYKIEAVLINAADGANAWSASIRLTISDGAGGEALAAALIQRFAEVGVFRQCPASVIH